MREFDGDVRGEPALAHAVEHLEVVVTDSGSRGAGRDLLAQLGEHASDAVAGEVRRGVEGVIELFAR